MKSLDRVRRWWGQRKRMRELKRTEAAFQRVIDAAPDEPTQQQYLRVEQNGNVVRFPTPDKCRCGSTNFTGTFNAQVLCYEVHCANCGMLVLRKTQGEVHSGLKSSVVIQGDRHFAHIAGDKWYNDDHDCGENNWTPPAPKEVKAGCCRCGDRRVDLGKCDECGGFVCWNCFDADRNVCKTCASARTLQCPNNHMHSTAQDGNGNLYCYDCQTIVAFKMRDRIEPAKAGYPCDVCKKRDASGEAGFIKACRLCGTRSRLCQACSRLMVLCEACGGKRK